MPSRSESVNVEHYLEQLATFIHGALFFGHVLGVIHNVRKRNWCDVTIHGGTAVYDFLSAMKHWRRL